MLSAPHPVSPWGKKGLAGFSLTEVIIVIGAIGVLAAVCIPIIGGLTTQSKAAVAEKNMRSLNAAVQSFNQSNWELELASQEGTDDELAIFLSLQYRDDTVSRQAPGSPYLNPMFDFVRSSDPQDYRAIWNGRMFEMVSPSATGDGINLMRLGEMSGGGAAFPNGYRPVGAPW